MVLQRFLKRRGAARPLIVVLDDLHWGSETLDFVAHLLDEPPTAIGPVLLVGTLDEGLAADSPWLAAAVQALSRSSMVTLLDIPDLDEATNLRLAQEQLGLSSELAAEVVGRASGSPGLTIELVREWHQRGLLEPSERGLRLVSADVLQHQGTETVGAIRRGRVERVVSRFGEDALASLQLAAALGRQVDAFEWNHACSRAGIRAEAGLIDGLLAERLAIQDETGWSFRNEALRAELERSARQSGHWAVWNEAAAIMVRQRFPKGGHGVARRRALYLLEAGPQCLGEAVAELGEAAWEDVESNEFRPALATVERREAALKELGAGPSDPRWGECMLVRCGVLVHLGDHLRGLEEARRAEVEASRYGWNNVLARALGQQAVIALESGDSGEAIERWDEAIRLCSSRDVETRARLIWYLAEMRRKEGDFDAASQLHEGAAEHFARCGDSEGEGEAKLGLALVAHDMGLLAQAALRLDEAEPLFTQAGTRSGLGTAAGLRGALAHLRGDLEAAAKEYRRSAEILESLGSAAAIESLIKLGGVHALRRDFGGLEQALHRIETGGCRDARAPWEGHVAAARLALVAYRRDWPLWPERMNRAQTELERAFSVSEEFGTFARVAGDLAQAAGMAQQARDAYQLAEAPALSKTDSASFTIVDGMLSRLPKLS